MKIKILKDVYTSKGWRYTGEVHDLDNKTAKHYLSKGIGIEYKIEYKEEKAVKETKENKKVSKRTTKKAK